MNRTGAHLHVSLEGAIGENTPMFTLPMENTQELTLDLGKVTYINSIGVRQWILWTLKIPPDCAVKMVNCPFVFSSQASMVVGFMTKNMTMESLWLPYACENCKFEDSYLAKRGTDYEYPSAGQPSRVSVPEQRTCPKCKTDNLETDFLRDKVFKFLNLARL